MQDREILSTIVKPLNYHLSFQNLQFAESWKYEGSVRIECLLQNKTDFIIINSKGLDLREFCVLDGSETIIAATSGILYDLKSERVTIQLSSPVQPGNMVLYIRFTGIIGDTMSGFYRSKYKPAIPAVIGTPQQDEWHYMLSTQFEACDARSAFPCFDEPSLKATFELEIEVPHDLVVVSNMPVKTTKVREATGLKRFVFERTPVMSTYVSLSLSFQNFGIDDRKLLAWAIGDFEYVETNTTREYKACNGEKLPVRVYTTRGLKHQGKFALYQAARLLDFFSEALYTDYPLPKCDLLAVHEFAAGAMENWGLLTYRTTTLLYDEIQSESELQQRIVYVVAHELAHQWFGNLVTMKWWDDLWLNEGFATWAGWMAVNELYPEWKVWSQFLAEDYQNALKLDSLQSSHPVQIAVSNGAEVGQIFDYISYLKGSSIIRMLSEYLTSKVFLQGICRYLRVYQYGNASTEDLWSVLSSTSGQDVAALMNAWVRNVGFPVVSILESSGSICLRQSRYLTSRGSAEHYDDDTLWCIPIVIRSGNATNIYRKTFKRRELNFGEVDHDFYKLNIDHHGFYHTQYPPERLIKLASPGSQHLLSIEDKVGLLGDTTSLVISGLNTTPELLMLLEGLEKDQNYVFWRQVVRSLMEVQTCYSNDDKISLQLKKFALKLVSPTVQHLSSEIPANEPFLKIRLRKLLIEVAAEAGHEKIITIGIQKFRLWQAGLNLPPNERSTVFGIAVSNGGREEYEAVKAEYCKSNAADVKETCLSALAQTRDSTLTHDFLKFVTSEQVPLQDCYMCAGAISNNNKTREVLWQFTRQNWDGPMVKLRQGNGAIMERWIKMGMLRYSDLSIQQDILKFFEDKDTSAFSRTLQQVTDSIKVNAEYRIRDKKILQEWLETHGYE